MAGDQEDLERQAVIGEGGLETGSVGQHLPADLTLEQSVGRFKPTPGLRIIRERPTQHEQSEDVGEEMVAPQIRAALQVQRDVAAMRFTKAAETLPDSAVEGLQVLEGADCPDQLTARSATSIALTQLMPTPGGLSCSQESSWRSNSSA